MNNSTFARKWFEENYLDHIKINTTFFKKSKTTLKDLDERRKTLISIH